MDKKEYAASQGKRKKDILVLSIWIAFFVLTFFFFLKTMWPALDAYRLKNSYTKDAVWHKESTGWHNDVLIPTLFTDKVVHIGADSWYLEYVMAFADDVQVESELPAMLSVEEIEESNYLSVGHMVATVNATLFDAQVITHISEQTEDGGSFLFVVEDELLNSKDVVVFHDDLGNLYLKGYVNE